MNNEHLPISRRRLLAGTSAAAAADLLDAFLSQTSFAKAPMLNTQAPHFYRFKLGNFEGTIVSDGTLPLGKPEDNFVGLTKPKMGKQLTDAFWETATKNLKPNRERMQFIKDGEEIIPGVHAMLAPGHTVGHTIFMIDSGGKQLCYVGDLAHHPVLLLQKPLTEFKYDTDPKQSAQSRVKMLSMLADKKIPLLAYHFAWPGVGHVAKQGDGFRFYPEGMKMEL